MAADPGHVGRGLLCAAAVLQLAACLVVPQQPFSRLAQHPISAGTVATSFLSMYLALSWMTIYVTLMYFEGRRSEDSHFMPFAPTDLVGVPGVSRP